MRVIGWKRIEQQSLKRTMPSWPVKISFARAAISQRLHELRQDSGGTTEERIAIGKALTSLDILRRERLGNRSTAAGFSFFSET